jgi:L-fuconolactonase
MIDTHVHLWQLGRNGCTWPTPDLKPIYRDVTFDDLRAVTSAAGVDRVVLVQSQEADEDTAWVLSIAGDPLIAAVVGWVDLFRPDASAAIGALARNPLLRGLRPMVQDREADWYDAPGLDPALTAMTALQLVFEALVRPRHLPALLRLAMRHPDLAILINHAAKPDASDLASWSGQMGLLAQLPNVSCKFSGLLTELPAAELSAALAAIFDHLWNAFGAERLVWGSDWPVLELAGAYGDWADQCRRLVPLAHHEALFETNARRIYGIQE